MKQITVPEEQQQYSSERWDSITGVVFSEKQKREKFINAVAKGNPPIDNNVVKGYN